LRFKPQQKEKPKQMANKYLGSDDPRGNYEDIFYMKMVTKKDENPHFSLKIKEGSDYIDLPDTPTSVSGTLKSIDFGEYEWEKQTIKTVKFQIEKVEGDINQLYLLSSSYTATLRTILNTLLNVQEPIKKITISLIKNKAGYNGAFLVINGRKGEWKFKYDFLKTMIEIEKTKKGEIFYYDKLDAFLEEEMLKHMPIIIPGSMRIHDEPTLPALDDVTETMLNDIFGED